VVKETGMRKQKGFTLIELLIVVAIIGIIAAIAISSLLRARVSANEAATVGDLRTIISAEAAYNSSNTNLYGQLSCLSTPSAANCLGTTYGSGAPTFLDSTMATDVLTKSGYVRTMNYNFTGTNTAVFCMLAQPQSINRTGVRSFGGDDAGVIGGTSAGIAPVACCNIAPPVVATNVVLCPGIK
jgi:prepilin-type N-terminal cleavage/methylation domain-containing protein